MTAAEARVVTNINSKDYPSKIIECIATEARQGCNEYYLPYEISETHKDKLEAMGYDVSLETDEFVTSTRIRW